MCKYDLLTQGLIIKDVNVAF